LAQVAQFIPPPVNDGFSFFWNPTLTVGHTCVQKKDPKIKFRSTCSTASEVDP
jgi:hypothetical protein